VTLLLEKAKNMPEKAGQFWQEITVGRYSFDTRSAIAEQVKTLTLDDIITLYNDAITEKKFSWAVFSKGGDIENLTPLSEQNRSQLPAFPRPDLTAIPTTN
jgi:secreted Zn-dependent insulinase-like peptidase